MAALTIRSALLACAVTVSLPAASAGFIFYLGPTDIANHFMCAVNASLSAKSLQKIALGIQIVEDVTQNYTGEPEYLRGLLPNDVIAKMSECESYHRPCYDMNSDEGSGSGSSETLLANLNPLGFVNDTGIHPECEPDYYIPLVLRCFKEADLLFFSKIRFNDEADLPVEFFKDCLEAYVLNSDDSQDK